jgi:hypothetical protein
MQRETLLLVKGTSVCAFRLGRREIGSQAPVSIEIFDLIREPGACAQSASDERPRFAIPHTQSASDPPPSRFSAVKPGGNWLDCEDYYRGQQRGGNGAKISQGFNGWKFKG